MKIILTSIIICVSCLCAYAQDAFEAFKQDMKKLEDVEQEYREVIWGKNNFQEAYKDSVTILYQKVRLDKLDLAKKAMDANRNDKRFLWVLNVYVQNFLTLDELEAELNKFSPTVQNDKEWTEKMEFVKYSRLNLPGNPYIDFTVKGHKGEEIRLSELLKKNKLVLIDFWASWCGACRATMPHLKDIYPAYKEKGVEFFSVSLDDKEDAWKKAFKDEAIPWIDGSNLMGWKDPLAVKYAIRGIPHKVLIGQDGRIIGTGYFERGSLEKDLDEYLEKHK